MYMGMGDHVKRSRHLVIAKSEELELRLTRQARETIYIPKRSLLSSVCVYFDRSAAV